MKVHLLLCLCSCVIAREEYGHAALNDEITNLTGAPKVPWRMFSGYIDVSNEGEKPGSRMMFYWFVESETAPSTDPVILWTNGGPGCTGLGGFLSEQGPFRVVKGGDALERNDFAWSRLANMVFIEQPVGVGFSTANGKIDYGDEQAATDNYRFVVNFFERFSSYKSQEFYISSESYGGHYLPTLATQLTKRGGVPQFRGVFLGNPLTYMMHRNYGQYGTAWGHQLLPAPLWKTYEAAECATTFPASDTCTKITGEMDTILAGFDPYALDFPKCNSAHAVGRHERWMLRRAIARAGTSGPNLEFVDDKTYQQCSEDHVTKYLNRADVQSAIHVKVGANWTQCSHVIGDAYNKTDVNAPMMPVWKVLMEEGELNIMIYSGDDDSICATLGTQQFVWDLGYKPKEESNWLPWKVDGQVAGFRTKFDVPSKRGRGAFTFATVHGAGHMVPATQPARSLALLQDFLGPRVEPAGEVAGSVVV